MYRTPRRLVSVFFASLSLPRITNHITHTICFFALASIVLSVPAATMVRSWVKTYDGPGNGNDNAFAIAVDASGNLVVAGQSAGTSGTPYVYDFVTMKYSSAGVPLWTNRYHGTNGGSDYAHALAIDRGNNIIVVGESAGLTNRLDFAAVKYSSAGVPLWTNRYRAPADSAIARAVAVDTNHNDSVVVAGYTYASGLVTIEYSAAGAPLWTNRYLGPVTQHYYMSSVAVDQAGNVFVTGISAGTTTGDDVVTLAYSMAGVPLWTNRYNGPDNGNDSSGTVRLDAAGNVFVSGGALSGGWTEFLAIKYSNGGVPLWTNRYRGTGSGGVAARLVVDGNGDVILAGTSGGSTTYTDFATVKYSNDGTPLWVIRHEGIYEDAVNGLAVDRNGNVFVTGYTTDVSTLRYDCMTRAYSGLGSPIGSDVWQGAGNDDDSGNAIATDPSGNVFVAGYTRLSSGLADLVVLKYSSTLLSPPLSCRSTADSLVLTWDNSLYFLQASLNAVGTFTNVPGATSPYTNGIAGSQKFFRLKAN